MGSKRAVSAKAQRAEEDVRHRVDEDGLRKTLALGTRKALRVVQLLEEIPARAGGEPLQVEENPRGHDRAGQQARPTSSTPAIRRTPRARSWATRAETLTECARGGRRIRGTRMDSQRPR